jgi:hypothetical protein
MRARKWRGDGWLYLGWHKVRGGKGMRW